MARARAALRASVVAIRALTLILAGAVPTPVSAQQPATTASLVFDGVTIVDVEYGKLLPSQRVVITGNRIQTVGDVHSVLLPKGAQVVDARGKYLIPGLWDLHTHSWYGADRFYPLFIANGITGIRDAGSPVPLDTLVQWRREILVGARIGPPRQILSGPMIQDMVLDGMHDSCTPPVFVCVSGFDSDGTRYLIDSLRGAGADMIKPRFIVTKESYFLIAAEARRLGIRFGGHVNSPLAVAEVSDSGAGIVDHDLAEGLEPCLGPQASVEQCRPLMDRFRRNGTWWVPTLVVWPEQRPGGSGAKTAAITARLYEVTEKFWRGSFRPGNWLRSPALTADSLGFLHVMQRAGAPILAGTDVSASQNGDRKGSPVIDSPGLSLHAELTIYATEGLTPLAALQSATINPAKMLRGTDSLGSVAAGKLADLVLLDADPLADITNTTTIRAVVANGRYFDRSALDQMLTEVQVQASEETKSKQDIPPTP